MAWRLMMHRDNFIVFSFTVEKYDGKLWTGLNWLRTGSVGGYCEYGNEYSCPIKSREFPDHLTEHQLIKKGLISGLN